MPRKNSARVRVAPHEVEATIIREEPLVLTLEERTALRTMLASVPFKKALYNLRLRRPIENVPVTITDGPNGAIAVNNQYHRMQGWRMCEEALGRQVENPKPAPKPAPDDYKRER